MRRQRHTFFYLFTCLCNSVDFLSISIVLRMDVYVYVIVMYMFYLLKFATFIIVYSNMYV